MWYKKILVNKKKEKRKKNWSMLLVTSLFFVIHYFIMNMNQWSLITLFTTVNHRQNIFIMLKKVTCPFLLLFIFNFFYQYSCLFSQFQYKGICTRISISKKKKKSSKTLLLFDCILFHKCKEILFWSYCRSKVLNIT